MGCGDKWHRGLVSELGICDAVFPHGAATERARDELDSANLWCDMGGLFGVLLLGKGKTEVQRTGGECDAD